jgi:hypothetical protein
MYMTPSPPHHHPHGAHSVISDAPIARFAELIEETHVSEWQKRTAALQRLVDLIPEGSAYYDDPTTTSSSGGGGGGLAWYNSPPTLRRLAVPVSELLKDARSTVVKRTCIALSQLFTRCQGDARYLFRDLMPTVLSVHAQTVQVIRQAVQCMVLEAIAEVPCKMVCFFYLFYSFASRRYTQYIPSTIAHIDVRRSRTHLLFLLLLVYYL